MESGGDFTGEHLHLADPDLHSTVINFSNTAAISCFIILHLDVIYRAGLLQEEHLTVKSSLALQLDR